MNNDKYNNMFNKNSLEIKSNTNQNYNDFHKNNLCNKKNSFR